MTGFYLFAVQRTLKSLLQHNSSKASVLGCSAFLCSTSHIRTWLLGKTIALTIQTLVSKVMSLLFNKLSMFVIVLFPKSRSVQFSHSVMSNSLQPHGLKHARPPCPSPTLGVYSNSCPLSRWCHPTILSSVVLFSSLLQSFPASGFLHISQLFISGDQSVGSFSFGISPSNEYSGLISFRMDWLLQGVSFF